MDGKALFALIPGKLVNFWTTEVVKHTLTDTHTHSLSLSHTHRHAHIHTDSYTLAHTHTHSLSLSHTHIRTSTRSEIGSMLEIFPSPLKFALSHTILVLLCSYFLCRLFLHIKRPVNS